MKGGRNMRWSLNELYQSFESEEFMNDSGKILELIVEVNTFAEKELMNPENAKDKIEKYLEYDMTLSKLISRVLGYSSLTMSVDARNEAARENYSRIAMKLSDLTKAEVMFNRFIDKTENLEEVIGSSELLKEHEYILLETKRNAEYLLSDEEEILISRMSNTGSQAWTNLQNILTSTLLVDIEMDGEMKKLPLPAVRNLAYDKDPSVRKKAFEA